jgi:hypothetical protein
MTLHFVKASAGAASSTVSTALTTRASLTLLNLLTPLRPTAGHPAARGSPDKPATLRAKMRLQAHKQNTRHAHVNNSTPCFRRDTPLPAFGRACYHSGGLPPHRRQAGGSLHGRDDATQKRARLNGLSVKVFLGIRQKRELRRHIPRE